MHGTWENDRPPVAGVVGRECGQVRLQVCHHSDRPTLQPLVEAHTPEGSTVNTDEWQAYNHLPEHGRILKQVCHNPGQREWARDDDGDGVREVHCNTLEGAWTGGPIPVDWESEQYRRLQAELPGDDAMRPAGLGNQKGPRIQQVLRAITKERGSLNLDFLAGLPTEEARAWLTKFNGVGPKTAAIVLCFALGIPALPVDTHVYRVTGRIGLRPERMTLEQAHPHLESVFPPETYYAAHLNIIRLGREICTARKGNCDTCPIKKLCDYGKKRIEIGE